jgi:hypothetical protein
MTLLGNGNVGISTSSPAYGLDVNTSGGTLSTVGWGKALHVVNSGAVVWDKSGGTNYYFLAKNTEGIYQGLVSTDNGLSAPTYTGRIDEATGDWRWYKNAYIDGNVGIGTISPNEKLEITGNFRLPATTAAVGIIKSGANRFIHSFGTNNFFAGVNAGNFTMSGVNNTGIGYTALQSVTSASGATAIGSAALASLTTGIQNVAVGAVALYSNADGAFNHAIGTEVLFSNISGSNNIGIGYRSLYSNTTNNNIAIGTSSLFANTTGANNIAIGVFAGWINGTVANLTGSNNTYIGYNSGPGTSTQLSNVTTIGAGATVTASNSLILGSGVNVGIGTTAPTQALHVVGNICYTGTSGACSDIRYKRNIAPLTNSLANILQLQGVNYYWKKEEYPDKKFTDEKQIGLIAQEIEKIVPEVVLTDKDGYKSVDYSRLTPILVEAIKDQQKIIADLQKAVIELKGEAALQQKESQKLKSVLEQIKVQNNIEAKK